ncbi:MAG: alpha/beta hydrolase [Blastocatellia bacterium]|nr:alpha/beta hydrolase [Blastocatellia bacterium]
MNSQPARSLAIRAVSFVLTLAFLFLLAIYLLRELERRVTYHPVKVPALQVMPAPKTAVDVWFKSQGHRLHGWRFRSEAQPPTGTILYFHGNGGNIANVGWVGEKLGGLGYDVLVFDYQGYGHSEGKMRDERDVYANGEAAWRFLVEEGGVDPARIVFYGQSLGTAAAIDLATRKPCAAMILESGLSSSSSVASFMLPWLPSWLHRFAKSQFDSARKLPSVHCPVFISHGDPDSVLPTDEARKLFAAANEPKELLLVPGVDHNVFGNAGDAYFQRLAAFIQRAMSKSNQETFGRVLNHGEHREHGDQSLSGPRVPRAPRG